MPPGPLLAELLEGLPARRVSGFDTVRLLQAAYRQLCRDRAVFLAILLETGLRRPGSAASVQRLDAPGEFGCEEARAGLVWSRMRAVTTFGLAVDVFVRLPVLGEAMLAGRLDEPRARAFIEWTEGLTDAQAEQVCVQLLPEAGGLLVGELVDRIKQACVAIDPDWVMNKYRAGLRRRKVAGYRNPDGTASLGGYHQPVDRIAAAAARIDALARACKRGGDTRAIDLIRSDVYVGMLDGAFETMTDQQIVDHILTHSGDPDPDGSDESGGDGQPGAGGSGGSRPDGPGQLGGGDSGESGGGDVPGSAPGGGDRAGGSGGPEDDSGLGAGLGGGPGGGGAGGIRAGRSGPPGQGLARTVLPDRPALSETVTPGRPGTVGDPVDPVDPAVPVDPPGPARWAVPELRVRLSTVLGWDEYPGQIPGWDFVPAGLARRLAVQMGSAQWRFVVCDPDGHPVTGGLLAARPRAAGRRRARRDRRRGGIVEIAVTGTELDQLSTAADQLSAGGERPAGGARARPGAATDRQDTGAGSAGVWAPVVAELLRMWAAGVPPGGAGAGQDPGRRAPGAGLRRWVQLRDRVCVHPSCRAPAVGADQDHRIDYSAGGLTTEINLGPACRHDHRVKHDGGWHIEPPNPDDTSTNRGATDRDVGGGDGGDGESAAAGDRRVVVWVSPLGHRYPSRPPPVIVALPAPYPDEDGRDTLPEGWYQWTSSGCGCNQPCQCTWPILPPVPTRVPVPEARPGSNPPTQTEPEPPSFDPHEIPPF